MRIVSLALVVIGFSTGMIRAEEQDAAVGTWELEGNAGGTDLKFTLKVTKDAKGYKATMTSGDTVFTVKDFQAKDGTVKFKTEGKYNDTDVTGSWAGKVKGDGIKGSVDYEFGGSTGSFDFEGKRAKDKKDKPKE
ncbi:hypothetical protein [Frigoriglobus tundricola]|uniref:Uncharacterized protein n=1 Tax=Frigoriglobus tundricola TaxID=2774151 RepID=A0A6M5Z1G3_9BACT|nr:hypothetical protein [Frigoriglobus tundricola]QJX00190.1 hypothetical protein FTUN_7814 [Frigoriglobus tundricola]